MKPVLEQEELRVKLYLQEYVQREYDASMKRRLRSLFRRPHPSTEELLISAKKGSLTMQREIFHIERDLRDFRELTERSRELCDAADHVTLTEEEFDLIFS